MLPDSITISMRSQRTCRNGKSSRPGSWLTGSRAGLQKTDDGPRTLNGRWLPDMDLNHDKQIQSLLCYRYTIGQAGELERLKSLMSQSSRQTSAGLQEQRDVDACPGHAVPKGQVTIAQRFNAG